MAIAFIGYGIFFAFLPEMMPEAEQAKMQAESGPMLEIISAIAIGFGVFVLAIGILHIVAGIRVLKYRGRGMIMATYGHVAAGTTRLNYDILRSNKHRTCDLGFDRIPQPRRKNRLQNGRRWHGKERSRTSVLLLSLIHI